jgi:hypothetical protein
MAQYTNTFQSGLIGSDHRFTGVCLLDVDGRIILRWIFRKWDVEEWTGLIWVRIGTRGGHL